MEFHALYKTKARTTITNVLTLQRESLELTEHRKHTLLYEEQYIDKIYSVGSTPVGRIHLYINTLVIKRACNFKLASLFRVCFNFFFAKSSHCFASIMY